MVKVRLKANKEAIEQAKKGGGGDFVVPKPGVYVLTMDQCKYGFSKTDGEEDQSKPRLECVYRIIGVGPEEAPVTENYGNLWDYVSFSDSSGWKRAEVLLAFGLMTPDENEADVELDTDSLVNRKVIARIRHEKDNRTPNAPPRARIGRLIKYGSDLSGGSLEDSAPDYGTDSPTPDEDVFGAEESTEEETDAYTEEGLQPFTLKELGTILSEDFKGEPRDHIVKGADGKLDNDATKTAVIKAILAAQGGGDAAPAEADEDPF